jgi:predicted kinase
MEVVLLMGMPGAGKTSFFRERFAATHLHLSKDLWPHARRREERLLRRLSEALGEGRAVVVDNTQVSRRARAGVLAVARAQGAHVVGYFFAVRLQECLARNARRTGRARVPEEAVCILAQQLQPPARSEGFDALYRVALRPDGGFQVEPWEGAAGADRQPPPGDIGAHGGCM